MFLIIVSGALVVLLIFGMLGILDPEARLVKWVTKKFLKWK